MIDEQTIAAILHAEWVRWTKVYEQYLDEEGMSRMSEFLHPFQDLPKAEQEPFLKQARKIVEMFERETQPNV